MCHIHLIKYMQNGCSKEMAILFLRDLNPSVACPSKWPPIVLSCVWLSLLILFTLVADEWHPSWRPLISCLLGRSRSGTTNGHLNQPDSHVKSHVARDNPVNRAWGAWGIHRERDANFKTGMVELVELRTEKMMPTSTRMIRLIKSYMIIM